MFGSGCGWLSWKILMPWGGANWVGASVAFLLLRELKIAGIAGGAGLQLQAPTALLGLPGLKPRCQQAQVPLWRPSADVLASSLGVGSIQFPVVIGGRFLFPHGQSAEDHSWLWGHHVPWLCPLAPSSYHGSPQQALPPSLVPLRVLWLRWAHL